MNCQQATKDNFSANPSPPASPPHRKPTGKPSSSTLPPTLPLLPLLQATTKPIVATVAEILKDRPSWYRDCRCLEVLSVIPTGNGGTIELIYMQTYAPTTLASARDFWTLRYTTSLEDGSLVTVSNSHGRIVDRIRIETYTVAGESFKRMDKLHQPMRGDS
ncbi:hypothetical protein RJ639_002013 [Escallonia herrerae]|uniref:START domain-containing protein n=1 Tax=Escallonia herrerae TaxID=1293975 RepID=A0AA88XBR6_9ASTE|nr:hypothetical protein RJ639_002013 [Escallonia herrerae]